MDGLRLPRLFFGTRTRRFTIALVGVITSLFVSAVLIFSPAFAAGPTWDGEVLKVDDQSYVKLDDDSKRKLNIDINDTAYGFIPDRSSQKTDAGAVVFKGDAALKSETKGTLFSYTFTPPDTYTLKDQKSVTVPAQPDASTTGGECKIEGVGWMACPISRSLAKGMDWVYGTLSGFLAAQPLQLETENNPLYQSWRVMRNIANSLFVVGFLVLIFSQVSSIGVSNYGVKKILPRIVIAAVAVNLSYLICAIAIDLSNITGYGVQSLLNDIRLSTETAAGSENLLSWESIVEIILAGGAGATALGVGAVGLLASTTGSIVSIIYIVLPILVGGILTLLVVLLILAARQALIVILTVISPIAILCYLLPGTETYFSKWRSLFFTMLIFFPAFSTVFGGSQLAGSIIISNAPSFTTLILGMAVQVAPLVLAPLILKLSGGLLNRVAGIVNNPNKGLVDRTKNWSKERAEDAANRQLSKNPANFKRGQILARSGRWAGNRRRNIKKRSEVHAANAENSWKKTAGYGTLDSRQRLADQTKTRIDSQHESAWNTTLMERPDMAARDVRTRISEHQAQFSKDRIARRYSEFEANAPIKDIDGLKHASVAETNQLYNLRSVVHDNYEQIALNSFAKAAAENNAKESLAMKMKDSNEMRVAAGGIDGDRGAIRAYANALGTVAKLDNESVANAETIIGFGNYTFEQEVGLANGEKSITVQVEDEDNPGTMKTQVLDSGLEVSPDIQEAAIKRVASGKNAGAVKDLLKSLDYQSLSKDQRQQFETSIMSGPAKPTYLSAGAAANVRLDNVKISGDEYIDNLVADAVQADAYASADTLVREQKEHLKTLKESLKSMREGTSKATLIPGDEKHLNTIMQHLVIASTDNRFRGQIGKREPFLRDLYDEIKRHKGVAAVDESGNPLPDHILSQ